MLTNERTIVVCWSIRIVKIRKLSRYDYILEHLGKKTNYIQLKIDYIYVFELNKHNEFIY